MIACKKKMQHVLHKETIWFQSHADRHGSTEPNMRMPWAEAQTIESNSQVNIFVSLTTGFWVLPICTQAWLY